MQPGDSVRECPSTGKRVEGPGAPSCATSRRIAVPAPDLDVRIVSLGCDARQVEQSAAMLSADEVLRAGRFHFERDRRRFIVARAMLRCLLAEHTGTSPASIVLRQTRHGKPCLDGPAAAIRFSVSHSGELAIYALSRSCVPGVDIESLHRDVDPQAIARRFFARQEFTELQRMPAAGRIRAFLACWTCKEAIVKAIGRGLQIPLDRVEVASALEAEPRVLSVPRGLVADWTLYRVDAGPDYVATVAAYRGPPEEFDGPPMPVPA